jgi:hypothetical protein
MQKSDGYPLINLQSQRLIKVFERRGWENNHRIGRRIEIDSISSICSGIHSQETISCETRSPELCVWG